MTRAADLAKLIAGGGTITVDDNSENLKLVTTDADASVGPTLRMDRQSASAADSDLLGKINFVGHNDAGTPEDIGYAGITAIISDASDGTEDGKLAINTMVAGTETSRIFVDAGETVFNEDSANLDFRVESDGNANMLFVDGGNNRVGIGTSSPSTPLHVVGNNGILVDDSGNGDGQIYFGGISGSDRTYLARSTDDFLIWNVANGPMRFGTNNSERLRILSGGGITFNGDTATANALDDYEEGTHDCTVTMASGSVTLNSGYNKIKYTKVGRVVTIQGQINVSSVSSPSGLMQISMPFSIDTTSDEGANIAGGTVRAYNADVPTGGLYLFGTMVFNTGANLQLEWVKASSATVNHVPKANEYLIISFSYATA